MTDITELAQRVKTEASAIDDTQWYLAKPSEIRSLVEALEKAQQRITQLESRTVKLPTTRLWAGVTECYEKSDVIAAIRAAGVEVSDD
ncbi:hypothetical protein Q8725_08350 [Klebsiella michiganensis]|uniref:hypothetical protein n=1 Tax=Klebsiella michiganensis TaxID=1134687 RepID=UPI002739E23F|nr:hypothetical protein [Klebsiella michiganensis]WLP18230.1 hypothetical protein Q8725_08350 [Klebsiella michiganensis]